MVCTGWKLFLIVLAYREEFREQKTRWEAIIINLFL